MQKAAQTVFRRVSSFVPPIYTRTGDKGTSALFTGERRSKYDSVFEALGTIDELNASLGVALEFAAEQQSSSENRSLKDVLAQLEQIQCDLQMLGSHVATPMKSAREAHLVRSRWPESRSKELETWIDGLSNSLPPLRNFILPGGGKCSASLHFSRRAERSLVPLLEANEIENDAYRYINRLSDYLFTCARYAAYAGGFSDRLFRPNNQQNESK